MEKAAASSMSDRTVEEITYMGADHGRVPAYLVIPAGKGPFAAVRWGHWMLRVRRDMNKMRYREEWLNKIRQAGVRRRAELFYQHPVGLQVLRGEFLAESRKHKAAKVLRQIPALTRFGPPLVARTKVSIWCRTHPLSR